MAQVVYKAPYTRKIMYPLGGMGTGFIGLNGNGTLNGFNPCAGYKTEYNNIALFFAVKAVSKDGKVISKILRAGTSGARAKTDVISKSKLPAFNKSDFKFAFPFANIDFVSADFPGKISMCAHNPFIFANDLDSSIPCAMFEFEIENNQEQQFEYTICLNISCLGKDSVMSFSKDSEGKIKHITLEPAVSNVHKSKYTSFCISTNCEDYSYGQYIFSKNKKKTTDYFWQSFNNDCGFDNTLSKVNTKTCFYGGALCGHIKIAPLCKQKMRFTVSWYNPYSINSWDPIPMAQGETLNEYYDKNSWKNYYCNFYRDARQSSVYCMRRYDKLVLDSKLFSDALYNSTLPEEVLKAVGQSLCFLKSDAIMRNADGTIFGFDGDKKLDAFGAGTSTSEYNYAYALAFLFPKLERSIRVDDYKLNQNIYGAMAQRMCAPKGRKQDDFKPCVESQLGGVLRAFREFKICGSKEWLMEIYNKISLALDFVFDSHNDLKWDEDKSGVMKGAQQISDGTYLFGSNPYLCFMYLTALAAGEQMAEIVGDKKGKKKYGELFANGKEWVEQNLFNGRYYCQNIDLSNKALLQDYGEYDFKDYWNESAQQIVNQQGDGCHILQVMPLWNCGVCGLENVVQSERIRSSLKSIYDNNFLNKNKTKRKGVLLCSYPKDKIKPAFLLEKAGEIAQGYEYPFACHLMQQGFYNESLEIVKKVCKRFDGKSKNPFDCSDVKNMSGYCLINTASGFEFDMYKKYIGFDPVKKFEKNGTFIGCFAIDNALGIVEKGPDYLEIKMLSGKLDLRYIGCPSKPLRVLYHGRKWDLKVIDGTVADMGNIYPVTKEKGIMIYL